VSDEGRLVAGRYRLTEQIGRGGMGTVWRADDEVLGRQVAVKRLHAQAHLADEELATLYERTRREARSAARIAHRNVVVVHDVVDDDGLPCIVMEYIPTGTLGEVLRGGRTVPPEEAARIGLGMIAALRAAHEAGVLHRDVKPGNVLLAADGRVVLTDFGIAMTVGASTLTKTGEMVGSIDYIAPERMRGRKPGPASDLWALGATLYQAVEGRPPFRKGTAMETAYAIAVDPLEPMKQAGPLEPLIEALLVKDPDERPSAEQTENALRAARSGVTDTTTVVPLTSSASHAYAARRDEGASPVTGSATDATTGPVAGSAGGGRTAPSPPTGAGRGRDRNRGSKRRVPLWGVVTVPVLVAAVVAGGLYATRDDGGEKGGKADRTTQDPATPTAPTSAPPPVPEGFRLVKVKDLGIAFPVPDGWTAARKTAEEVSYKDEAGLAEITIGVVDPAGSHPVTHFESIEANTKVNYPTYRKLRMQKTSFRGQPAAVWEFTFQGRARVFRAIDLGFGREGAKEYDIYLSAPDLEWATYRPVFDKVRDGFITTG
jgi:tRNA A-37 threonylcarbamoyl transferase component Bud32